MRLLNEVIQTGAGSAAATVVALRYQLDPEQIKLIYILQNDMKLVLYHQTYRVKKYLLNFAYIYLKALKHILI